MCFFKKGWIIHKKYVTSYKNSPKYRYQPYSPLRAHTTNYFYTVTYGKFLIFEPQKVVFLIFVEVDNGVSLERAQKILLKNNNKNIGWPLNKKDLRPTRKCGFNPYISGS